MKAVKIFSRFSIQKNSKIEIFCNIINVFIVTFDHTIAE